MRIVISFRSDDQSVNLLVISMLYAHADDNDVHQFSVVDYFLHNIEQFQMQLHKISTTRGNI